jgi:hypothetical protein
MTHNCLKINDDKTEVLVITRVRDSDKVNVKSVRIGDTAVQVAKTAKNIGVLFDSNLSMHEHITNTCRACYLHLRKIASIRRYITREASEAVVHALITSGLDYANSLVYGLPKYQVNRLQRVQNMAARIITQTGKYTHITPVLYGLHWLPIPERVEFKIITMVFKIINGTAPMYLEELVELYSPKRELRSSNKLNRLTVQRCNTKTYGQRNFSVAAPFYGINFHSI